MRYPPCTPNTSPNTSPTPKGLNSAPQRHAMRAVGGALLGNRSRHSAQSAPAGGFLGDCYCNRKGTSLDEDAIPNFEFVIQAVLQYSKRSQLNTQFPGSCCSPSSTTRSPKATRTPNRTTSSLHCSYSSTDGRASRNRGTRKSNEVLSIVVAHFYYSTAVIT